MDESRDEQERHPRPCPVCRVAMVVEETDDKTVERLICFNCGAVVVVMSAGDNEPTA